MKNEMDVLKMDERQRFCWLLANRFTLIVVGVCWIGLIFYRISQNEIPWFLIIMLPVFGIIRLLSYLVYKSRMISA